MKAHDSGSTGAVIGAALAGGTAVCAYMLPGLAGLSTDIGAPLLPQLRHALGVADRTRSGRGYALTFDDGPHAAGTPAALEILGAAGTRATFFLVGEQVRRAPALAREIVAAGHQIGLHCDRHRNLLRLTPMQAREDIARAHATITEACGRDIELYRPPYGALSAAALAIARARNWRTLLWRRWGRDWQAQATAQSIAARLVAGTAAGDVLLLHDADDYSAPGSWQHTVAALPRVLELLADRGLEPTLP